jgi:TolB-like protein
MMKPTRIPSFLLLAFTVSCANYSRTQASTAKRDAVRRIVEQLVETVETRRDPQGMQIYVSDLKGTGRGRLESMTGQAISEDLQHHVLMEINTKLNILEKGFMPPPELARPGSELRAWAKQTNATHVLVGDYVVRGDDICISLRLVDVETRLIVAAAGGMVPGGAGRHRSSTNLTPRYVSSRRR